MLLQSFLAALVYKHHYVPNGVSLLSESLSLEMDPWLTEIKLIMFVNSNSIYQFFLSTIFFLKISLLDMSQTLVAQFQLIADIYHTCILLFGLKTDLVQSVFFLSSDHQLPM